MSNIKKKITKKLIGQIFASNCTNEFASAIIKLSTTPLTFIRLVLIVFLLLAVGLSSFLTIQSFLNFFNYDVVTTYRIVQEIPVVFPQITICYTNMFASEYAVEFLKEINKRYFPKKDMFDKNQMDALSYGDRDEFFSDILDMAKVEVFKVYFLIFKLIRSEIGKSKSFIVEIIEWFSTLLS